jgi:serine/threonine protein kinase
VDETGGSGHEEPRPTDHDRAGFGAPSQRVPESTPPADAWYSGPAGDRRAYAVQDITGFDGGQGRVVQALRRTFPGDTVGYEGPVSLKLITDRRPDRVQRLQTRWTRLAGIEHPNVARALEVFEGPGLFRTECPPVTDDVLYVAAVWVEGRCLREIAPLGARRAFAMARDLAAGIATMHAHDLVHRDIHPGNVVIDETGRAVLIDLGSARPDDGRMTTTAAGALGFIAPETTHSPGGPAADRWGLGMVTIHALLGHPRGGLDARALAAELKGAMGDVPRRARAIELLVAMVDPEPTNRPSDPVQWAVDLTACLSRAQQRAAAGVTDGQRSRARPRVPVAVAAGAILIAGAALLAADPFGDSGSGGDDPALDSSDPPGGPSVEPTAADGGPGETPACATAAPDAPGASAALAAAAEELAPDSCAAGPAGTYVDAEVLYLSDGEGRPDGVVLLTPAGTEIRLTEVMWDSYNAIILRNPSPEATVQRAGYPDAVEQQSDPDAVVVRLERGGLLIGPRADSQLFFIPPSALGAWNEAGGLTGTLGFPTANPYALDTGELRFDYEGGYMSAPPEDLAAVLQGKIVDDVTVLDADDAAEPLAGLDLAGGAIVRQHNQTSWWVDEEGVRHWIPDAETFRCLGGAAAQQGEALPGWAVATLPQGEAISCP